MATRVQTPDDDRSIRRRLSIASRREISADRIDQTSIHEQGEPIRSPISVQIENRNTVGYSVPNVQSREGSALVDVNDLDRLIKEQYGDELINPATSDHRPASNNRSDYNDATSYQQSIDIDQSPATNNTIIPDHSKVDAGIDKQPDIDNSSGAPDARTEFIRSDTPNRSITAISLNEMHDRNTLDGNIRSAGDRLIDVEYPDRLATGSMHSGAAYDHHSGDLSTSMPEIVIDKSDGSNRSPDYDADFDLTEPPLIARPVIKSPAREAYEWFQNYGRKMKQISVPQFTKPADNSPAREAYDWFQQYGQKVKGISLTQFSRRRRTTCVCWDRLRRMWADEDSTLRRLVSVVFLVAYSFTGAAVFHLIEPSYWDYWESLSFVTSLFTTIGYGNVFPRTTGGKVFTCFYSLIGLPTAAIALSDLGLIMMRWFGVIWMEISRCSRNVKRAIDAKRKVNVDLIAVDSDNYYSRAKKGNLPISIAVSTLILWLFMSSFYFYEMEKPDWDFFESFYFFFISVTTIGLGDFSPSQTARTVADYVFIFGGIALFTLVVRLVVEKLENIDDRIAAEIINEYTHSLQNSYAFNDDGDNRMAESEAQQRRIIKRLIKEKGGYMRFFMGRRVEEKMLRKYQERANMRLKSTQTVVRVRNVALASRTATVDVQVMVGDSFLKSTDDYGPLPTFFTPKGRGGLVRGSFYRRLTWRPKPGTVRTVRPTRPISGRRSKGHGTVDDQLKMD